MYLPGRNNRKLGNFTSICNLVYSFSSLTFAQIRYLSNVRYQRDKPLMHFSYVDGSFSILHEKYLNSDYRVYRINTSYVRKHEEGKSREANNTFVK